MTANNDGITTCDGETPSPLSLNTNDTRAQINETAYQQQHKLRLSYMPWLYWRLKDKHKLWAVPWQTQWQTYLQAMETIDIQGECFIAPEAKIFAEPGRPVVIGAGSSIAADCVIHGPVTLGQGVSINHHCSLDGGRKGIIIGDNSRIAAHSSLYAFNHGHNANTTISEQPVSSKGIRLEDDVWLGAHCGVTDGVHIGRGAVIGMHSVVTKNIEAMTVVAGNPAKFLKLRT